jgi:hypothetical protein
MKSRSSNPEFSTRKRRRLYKAGFYRSPALPLPLRHSLKSRDLAYRHLNTSSSQRETRSLTPAESQRQDLTNFEYHPLYDPAGSRFYASCPELIDTSGEENGRRKGPPTGSTFYQVKSRSTWRIQASEGRRRSRISKIAHGISSYFSGCVGKPDCFGK